METANSPSPEKWAGARGVAGRRAGVVGLGDIGRGVAGALARAGVELTVCDVRPEATGPFAASARIASDPEDLAATSEVILVAVTNDAQVLDVADRAMSGARPGSTVVILSTVSPDTVHTVAARGSASGVHVLDCGVSGGPAAAAEGTLVAMVGGDQDVIGRVRHVLDGFSSVVLHMGPLGAGLRAKLARNLVQYASWLAAYEAQVLAEAAGIELAKLAEAIRTSDQMIGGASRLMFRASVAPFGPDDDAGIVGAMQAAADLAHKDLRAVLELGAQLDVALPVAALTQARTDALFGLAPDPFAAGGGASGTADDQGGSR
jgi:3-hydroxyisobutyrate dehydrogenase-like beta-hydroxyacid dehydrogenase